MLTLRVPPDWEVRQEAELIEIVPPRPVGAAHISVLRRTTSAPIDSTEAESLVRSFATRQGQMGVSVSERGSPDRPVAYAEFKVGEGSEGTRWDVVGRVWRGRGLICSFASDPGAAGERDLALAMFATIAPENL